MGMNLQIDIKEQKVKIQRKVHLLYLQKINSKGIPAHPTADSDVESFHWSIERDCLAWDDIVDDETLIKYTTEYMKEYLNTEIKTRGYSPIDKIKETYEIDNVIYPMPQILNIQSTTTTFNIIDYFYKIYKYTNMQKFFDSFL